jgi:hypothetical protein
MKQYNIVFSNGTWNIEALDLDDAKVAAIQIQGLTYGKIGEIISIDLIF